MDKQSDMEYNVNYSPSDAFHCHERIYRTPSVELFPENIPGTCMANQNKEPLNMTGLPKKKLQKVFKTDLDSEDVRIINELGRFNANQLLDFIKGLQAKAFTVSLEEARQYDKGRVLDIFKKPPGPKSA